MKKARGEIVVSYPIYLPLLTSTFQRDAKLSRLKFHNTTYVHKNLEVA